MNNRNGSEMDAMPVDVSIVIISKDEPEVDGTLEAVVAQARAIDLAAEVIVVDASAGRLDRVRQWHGDAIRWIDFVAPADVQVSIPHQRNVGVRASHGSIIIFTDAGCLPEPCWLVNLLDPIRTETEDLIAGAVRASTGSKALYDTPVDRDVVYLRECPTINLAFRRDVFDVVGGFDERFEYGSDVDFSWRLVDAGHRVRFQPTAVIRHDWGSWRRQLRRSRQYGGARLRLYRKHHHRVRHILRDEPVLVLYSIFLVLLPFSLVFPMYPLLLIIPLWRNRRSTPCWAVLNHLHYAVGALRELVGL